MACYSKAVWNIRSALIALWADAGTQFRCASGQNFNVFFTGQAILVGLIHKLELRGLRAQQAVVHLKCSPPGSATSTFLAGTFCSRLRVQNSAPWGAPVRSDLRTCRAKQLSVTRYHGGPREAFSKVQTVVFRGLWGRGALARALCVLAQLRGRFAGLGNRHKIAPGAFPVCRDLSWAVRDPVRKAGQIRRQGRIGNGQAGCRSGGSRTGREHYFRFYHPSLVFTTCTRFTTWQNGGIFY